MGTEARLVLYASDEGRARAAAEAAFDRLDELDARLSDYRADSELSRLPERAAGRPVEASADLVAVLARALEVARASGGAFDPTVGPLVKLWRRAREEGRLPEPETLAKALSRVGFDRVEVDAQAGTVGLADGDVHLDLGGIAKGYAADEARKVLQAEGCPRCLVDLGGDLSLGDPPPGRDGWVIEAGCGEAKERLVRARCAVCTSGADNQALELDGVRYSHILDPRSGRAVTDPLCVTVIASDGALADALASAVSVLGRHDGRALCRTFDVEVLVRDLRFRDLFDGESLAGWTTKGGRYDGAARFVVEDGCIVGRPGEGGAGGLLYTESFHSSFEFECEVLTEAPFDSGVFVRMAPRLRGVQVTLDDRAGGEIGALYSDGFLLHNESARRRYRSGRWNHLAVRVTGFDLHVEAWLDGAKIVDHRVAEDPRGFAPVGRIGLQVHDVGDGAGAVGEVRFRRLRVRDLPVFFGDEEGFRTLLPAADLSSFEILDETEEAWVLRDGGLLLRNVPGSGLLATREDFADLDLRARFTLSSGASGGVYLRGPRDGRNPARGGFEIQLLDDARAPEILGGEPTPTQLCGALWGAVAPAVAAAKPAGVENLIEVRLRGDRLAVAQNTKILYDVHLGETDLSPPFGDRAPAGFVGLQRVASPLVEGDVLATFGLLAVRPIGNVGGEGGARKR